MTLTLMTKPAEACGAVDECRIILPHDPEQWIRVARIYATNAAEADSQKFQGEAMAALKQAIALGFRDVEYIKASANLTSLRQLSDFGALVADLELRAASADRQ